MKGQKWNILFNVIFIMLGMSIGFYLLPHLWAVVGVENGLLGNPIINMAIGALIFIILIFLLQPWKKRLFERFEHSIQSLSISQFLIGLIGLIIGLFLAWLVNIQLTQLGWPFVSDVLPIIITVGLGFVGYYIAQSRIDDLQALFERLNFRKSERVKENISAVVKEEKTDQKSQVATSSVMQSILDADYNFQPYKILDTSVIIDGRILDVLKTGFIEGVIIVPNFVLQELQYIADSSDSIKRVRGRRGLDVLNQIQDLPDVTIEFYTGGYEDTPEVDLKLLRLAKDLNGMVVTNDYNLNKVSQFHKIKVLNVNELAGSLKIVVIPGEILEAHIIKPGTERQQGVAYMDDGTMIVIEEGKHHIDETLHVEVTSAIQTNAGRMIFAKIVE